MYMCEHCGWQGSELFYAKDRQGYCPRCHASFRGCFKPVEGVYFAVFNHNGVLGVGCGKEEAVVNARNALVPPIPENWWPDDEHIFLAPCTAEVFLRARRLTLNTVQDLDIVVSNDGVLQMR